MKFLSEHVPGQTLFGIYQNLRYPEDCGGIAYIALHVGRRRFTLTWDRGGTR